uniref:Uncharacterized protein n=1 Tax=Pygocentrus nattereri TaxID=42514 RepID=A0A3B4CP60_PYGNA
MTSPSIRLERRATASHDLLQEFNAVAEELSAPSLKAPHAYEHLLNEAKRRSNDGVNDSGIEDADEGESFLSHHLLIRPNVRFRKTKKGRRSLRGHILLGATSKFF